MLRANNPRWGKPSLTITAARIAILFCHATGTILTYLPLTSMPNNIFLTVVPLIKLVAKTPKSLVLRFKSSPSAPSASSLCCALPLLFFPSGEEDDTGRDDGEHRPPPPDDYPQEIVEID